MAKEDWNATVEWMRESGVEEASFTPTGILVSVRLVPGALPPTQNVDPQVEALRKAREETLTSARQWRQRYGAVGGLVPISTDDE